MKIEEEIRQKQFRSDYQKAHINILFTAAWLTQQSTQVLKPFGISWQQFNILRILRGLHPQPVTVKLLTERMIDKMSNASRLVDKLKLKGLVEREECPMDRRRVDVRITDRGLELINRASEAMGAHLERDLSTLKPEEARELNGLLDKLRG